MEKDCSNPEKFIVNLKHLPPIDPPAKSPSQSQFSLKKPKTRALGKVVKPSVKEGLKLVEYDKRPTKADQADAIQPQKLMVEDASFGPTLRKKYRSRV